MEPDEVEDKVDKDGDGRSADGSMLRRVYAIGGRRRQARTVILYSSIRQRVNTSLATVMLMAMMAMMMKKMQMLLEQASF